MFHLLQPSNLRLLILLGMLFLGFFSEASSPDSLYLFSPNPTIQAWTIGYDQEGRIRTEYCSIKGWLHPDGSWEKQERLDFKGKLLMRRTFRAGNLPQTDAHFNPDRSLDYEIRYQYNAQNRLVEESLHYSDGSLGHRWVVTYDDSGRIHERRNFDAAGTLSVTETYTYDASGRTAKATRGAVGEWEYTFDQQGRVLKVAGGPASGDGADTTEYQYDAQGRVVLEKTYHPNGALKSETAIEYP